MKTLRIGGEKSQENIHQVKWYTMCLTMELDSFYRDVEREKSGRAVADGKKVMAPPP